MIGDADSDARKQSLFERVRAGSVRVLIGSTQKMGTGTNVQRRLVALHHLDASGQEQLRVSRDALDTVGSQTDYSGEASFGATRGGGSGPPPGG